MVVFDLLKNKFLQSKSTLPRQHLVANLVRLRGGGSRRFVMMNSMSSSRQVT